MTQWTDSTSIWTTRSSDEWVGDGGASPASPIPVTATVQDHFAGTLSNVYQDTLLSVSTTLPVHAVEVNSTVEMDAPLSVSMANIPADLVIDTACHVSTQAIKTTLPVHEGQRVSIAYQTVKPHAQITPKNPIVESDVTLNPASLSISADVGGTVYAGYYTEVAPSPITAATFMYPGGVIVSTEVWADTFALEFGTGPTVIDVSPTLNIDLVAGIRAALGAPQIESTCTVDVAAANIAVTFQGIELVATGFAAQDDLPIRMVQPAAQVWHDNNVYISDTGTVVAAVQEHVISGGANIDVSASAVGLEVGSHEVSADSAVEVSAPLGVGSALSPADIYYDFLLPATLPAATFDMQPAEAHIDANVYMPAFSLHAVALRPDYGGPRVTEFALLQSALQREVVLSTPVNAYSRAAEVEA